MRIFNTLRNKKTLTAAAVSIVLLAASVALASSGEGGHVDSGVLIKDFLYRSLNFAMLVGLLAFFVTKPIKNGLAGRRESIEKALDDAKKAQEAAEAKFAEYDSKLAKASAEIDGIYESIKREGELERDKTIATAKEMAVKLEQEAHKSAELEVTRAKAELRGEAVKMAIEIAGDILNKNFTAEDHSRLVDEYMQKVGELH